MRLAWYSNAPWTPTGYGMQTAEIVPRIRDAGHEVMVTANYGLAGAPMDWEGIQVYPMGVEPHSTALSPAHAINWGADWLITLYDVWPLERKFFPANTISWTPIDHQPVPPEVMGWFKPAEGQDGEHLPPPRAIAMSRFGATEFQRVGIEAAYIPHSINTSVFHPTDGVRDALDVPKDAYLVVINAANKGTSYERQGIFQPGRKAWFEMFMAASRFMAEHTDAYLYVHTDAKSPIGYRLERLARVVDIPADRLRWADPYAITAGLISPADVADIYSSADVLLATSMGEGFGIPVIEAQACGTPVIVTDFSAQPELVGAGWKVKGQPWWDEGSASAFFVPFIGDTLAKLNEAYAARGDNGLRERAVAKAAEYDSDLVFDRYWRPLLAEMEASLRQHEIASKDFAPPRNRAERRAAKKSKRQAA